MKLPFQLTWSTPKTQSEAWNTITKIPLTSGILIGIGTVVTSQGLLALLDISLFLSSPSMLTLLGLGLALIGIAWLRIGYKSWKSSGDLSKLVEVLNEDSGTTNPIESDTTRV